MLQLILLYIYISFCFTSLYSVPANTAIYQSAVAFVFVMSVPILRERITAVKVNGNVNYNLILYFRFIVPGKLLCVVQTLEYYFMLM